MAHNARTTLPVVTGNTGLMTPVAWDVENTGLMMAKWDVGNTWLMTSAARDVENTGIMRPVS